MHKDLGGAGWKMGEAADLLQGFLGFGFFPLTGGVEVDLLQLPPPDLDGGCATSPCCVFLQTNERLTL